MILSMYDTGTRSTGTLMLPTTHHRMCIIVYHTGVVCCRSIGEFNISNNGCGLTMQLLQRLWSRRLRTAPKTATAAAASDVWSHPALLEYFAARLPQRSMKNDGGRFERRAHVIGSDANTATYYVLLVMHARNGPTRHDTWLDLLIVRERRQRRGC